MTGHDLDELLHDLAADAEREARPVDPGRVRRLGERRRHRRHALTAAAAAVVVVLAGGAVLSQGVGTTSRTPPPVASGGPSAPGTPSAAAPRTLGPQNLLRPADVPTAGGPALEVAPPGSGRPADEVSVCIPDGLADLGATETATRDFRYPGQQRPAIQTVILQLADDGAAARAERTVRGWVDGCGATLRRDGRELLGSAAVRWVAVDTPAGTAGRFAELPSYREDDTPVDEGVFESLGVARAGDRLMLTVRVVAGMDDNVSLDPEGDPDLGTPAHPQFGLVRAAAQRLAE